MHTYSIDNDSNLSIYTFLVVIGGCLDILLNNIFSIFISGQLVYFISFVTSFPLVFYIFNEYLWKIKIINNLINYPNIGGDWIGTVKNEDYEMNVNVEIVQTWTKISFNLTTETAESYSQSLSFITKNSKNPKVIYTYFNKVKNTELIKSHSGTAELTIKNDFMEGEYYTNNQRKTYGVINLKKI